jgi:mannitol-1-phosphate/altronate dehydrogenase
MALALQGIVLRYVTRWYLRVEFSGWIKKSIFFNTLVNRIVLGLPKETIQTSPSDTRLEAKLTVAVHEQLETNYIT